MLAVITALAAAVRPGSAVRECDYRECDEEFEPKNDRHRFHSSSCRVAEWRERKKDRAADEIAEAVREVVRDLLDEIGL